MKRVKELSKRLVFIKLYGINKEKFKEGEMLTPLLIREAQRAWAYGIVEIGRAYLEGKDYRKVAEAFLEDLYAFREGPVLFKPTKAREVPFRYTLEDALSYFIGGKYPEDKGFALEPWKEVRFEVAGELYFGEVVLSQGHYYFTSAKTGETFQVEFTFGYKLVDKKPKIILQHSSLPFKG